MATRVFLIVWAALAMQHDGSDRWYLEALGIAARGRWDECLAAWLEMAGDDWNNTKAGRDIVWRSRASMELPALLVNLIADSDTPGDEIPTLLPFTGLPELAAIKRTAARTGLRRRPRQRRAPRVHSGGSPQSTRQLQHRRTARVSPGPGAGSWMQMRALHNSCGLSRNSASKTATTNC